MKLPFLKNSDIIHQKPSLYIGVIVAFIIFILSIFGTFFAWNFVKRGVDNNARELFEKRIIEVESLLNRRFDVYLISLYSTRGIFDLKKDITVSDWDKYFEKSNVRELYPGISTIGYIERVKSAEKTKFLESWKAEGGFGSTLSAQLAIHPEAEKTEYHIVKYLEPLEGRESVLGFDFSSEKVRNKALQAAGDSGKPAASGIISSLATGERSFDVLLPIYKDGMPTATIEERRRAVVGSMVGVFRVNDFFSQISPKGTAERIDVEIFDITELGRPTEDNLLYDTDGILHEFDKGFSAKLIKREELNVAGRTWMLSFRSLSAFPSDIAGQRLPWAVLILGMGFSFLVFIILFLLTTSRWRALRLARAMTRNLETSERRYADLIENAPDAIITIDKVGIIKLVNPAAESIFGYSPSEVLGKHFASLGIIAPSSISLARKTFEQAISGRLVALIEIEVIRKNGEHRTLEINQKTLLADGVITGLQLILRDATERKKAEEVLQNQLRLESEIEEKERNFISVASHQLLTPLVLIEGYVSMILSGENLTEKEIKSYLLGSLGGVRRMVRLVKDLLSTSRIENKTIMVVKSKFDINETVKITTKNFELLAKEKGLRLDCRVSGQIEVLADRDLAVEILSNLLANAVKYTEKGGVVVSTSIKNDKMACIEVSDTGVGIDRKDLPHIFEKFYFSQMWIKKQGESTGLGLYIASELAKLMSGTISVESQKGKGSSFTFTLPLAKSNKKSNG